MIKTCTGPVTKKLSADYTVEYSDEIQSVIGEELAAAIDSEIAYELAVAFLNDQGWYSVALESWLEIDSNWLTDNIVGNYRCFGHYWCFELESDAVNFVLRWM